MANPEKDQTRLIIASFIVATVIAIFALPLKIKLDTHSGITFVIASVLFGLLFSAFFALLFVMSKGYMLMYSKKRENFVDHHLSHWLYDLSIGSYVFLIPTLVLSYLYSHLTKLSSQGNWFATLGVIAFGTVIILVLSMGQIRDIIRYIKQKRRSKENSHVGR